MERQHRPEKRRNRRGSATCVLRGRLRAPGQALPKAGRGTEARVGVRASTSASCSAVITARSDAIATSSWSSVGSRVVSCWSARPGRIEHPHHARVHVAGREADDLVGEPGDQRDQQDARRDEQRPVGTTHERVDDDRDDHHRQQEVRAAANVLGREALRRLGRHLDAVLVGGDRLVLGAVVLEHTLHVAQAPDQQQVADEEREPERPLGGMEPEALERHPPVHTTGTERGQEDEQPGEDRRARPRSSRPWRPWRGAPLRGPAGSPTRPAP